MPHLFGTDGVRGVANRDLTPDLALALGRAAGIVLAQRGGVVVGRDTRVSGPMLEAALVAGMCSAGTDVLLAGIAPSPAVAWLTADQGAEAGAVISASHNPVGDNGIKFFSQDGSKISAELEERIEAELENPHPSLPVGPGVGRSEALADAGRRYVDYLLSTVAHGLDGLKVVLDCAYGAAWEIAPAVFARAGAEVVTMHAEPDGRRINVGCGSTAMDKVAARVGREGAHVGFGFDGDADRVLAVDDRGNILDGDRLLALLALSLQKAGRLSGDVVVSTVMSNLGFRRALEQRGVEVLAAPVGDKFVVEAMRLRGAMLGGEQSGHVVFAEHAATGDGILTALQVSTCLAANRAALRDAAALYEPWPQVLINVPVASRDALEWADELWDEVRAAEQLLGEDGRVLLRASGTESVVRVMVEASQGDRARDIAERLADAVTRLLG